MTLPPSVALAPKTSSSKLMEINDDPEIIEGVPSRLAQLFMWKPSQALGLTPSLRHSPLSKLSLAPSTMLSTTTPKVAPELVKYAPLTGLR